MNDNLITIDCFQTTLDEHRGKFSRFCELLITENQKYNLTRLTLPGQVEIRHFLDSLVGLFVLDRLSDEKAKPFTILDIGSGAGFPGLALAIARPQWRFISLEATAKKANFQTMVCDHLELDNVTVINERAESLAHNTQYREKFDVVLSRAVAAMPVLAELSLGFVKVGGAGLYWKGPSVVEELQTAKSAVKQMGAEFGITYSYGLPTEEPEPATLSLVKCKKVKPTPRQYPRVFGVIKKKPL